MSRIFLLSASLVLLMAGVCLLRSYRFVKVEGAPTIGLSQLKAAIPELPEGVEWIEASRGTALSITARPGQGHKGLRVQLPCSGPVQALHLRLDMEARRLERGKSVWNEGRIFVEWLASGNGKEMEIDGVSGASGNENVEGVSVVVRAHASMGFPVLLVENLGVSGELLIHQLEATAVRERAGWIWMRLVLAICWFSWIFAFLSGTPKLSRLRRCAAAAVWLATSALFAFPGPWKALSPMVIPFALETTGETAKVLGGGVASDGTQLRKYETPHGSVSNGARGSGTARKGWIIEARQQLKKMRPLLHVGFVFLTTAAFLWVVGGRRAAWLSAGLVLAIEASQTGFGYGFDWQDVLDLASGAVGILMALKFHGKFCHRLARLPGVLRPPA